MKNPAMWVRGLVLMLVALIWLLASAGCKPTEKLKADSSPSLKRGYYVNYREACFSRGSKVMRVADHAVCFAIDPNKLDDASLEQKVYMDVAPYVRRELAPCCGSSSWENVWVHYLPIRYLAQAFCVSDNWMHWDQRSKTLTIRTRSDCVENGASLKTVKLTVGDAKIWINGKCYQYSRSYVELVAPGRVMIPDWLAAEIFGGMRYCGLDDQQCIVGPPPPEEVAFYSKNKEEIERLLKE